MRRTPPVVISLRPQWVVQSLVAVIAVLAVGGVAAWGIGHDSRVWPVVLMTPFAAVWAWREAAVLPRRLRWDGQAWWLAEPGCDGELQVQLSVLIDLDTWLLLRVMPGRRWLPLSRAGQPAWGALRATLFAASRGAAHR